MKTLFKHNGQIVYSIDSDLYQTEMEELVKHIAYTIEAEISEIEVCFEELIKQPELSLLIVNSFGCLVFDGLEAFAVRGIRLSTDINDENLFISFLKRIGKNAEENLEFTI